MTSAFQQYQSGALDGKDTAIDMMDNPFPTAADQNLVQDNDPYTKKARKLVAHSFNETFFPDPKSSVKTTDKDFYIVWFAKVLENWKALVSTDVISGQYWEVTYDGNKKQTYVTHYVKRFNEAVTDETYASMP